GPANGQRGVVSRKRAFPGTSVSGREEPLGLSETRIGHSRPAMRGGVRSDSSGREFETPALFHAPLAEAYRASCSGNWRRMFSSSSFATCRKDRKSTRLNSSHDQTSYAVFCL